MGAVTDGLPDHLFESPRRYPRAQPVPRSGVKRGGEPLSAAAPMGSRGAPAAAVAVAVSAGKPSVFTAGTVPLLDWAAGVDQATRSKTISSALAQIRRDDPTTAAPAFFDIAESDPTKANKQICFAFCLMGSKGCDGFMPASKTRAGSGSAPRRQPCNRVHIDLGSVNWTSGVTSESYKGLCGWLKTPAAQKYFVPTQAFADSSFFTG